MSKVPGSRQSVTGQHSTGRLSSDFTTLEVPIVRRSVASGVALANSYFTAIYGLIDSGIVVYDHTGRSLYANDTATHLLGLNRAHSTSKSNWILSQDDGQPLMAETHPVARCLQSLTPVRGATVRIDRPDGTHGWLEFGASPVLLANGTVDHVVATVTDATARRQAELQMRAIRRIEKMRALGEMAGAVAHDVNQSLSLIAGHAELALGTLQGERPEQTALAIQALETILRAAHEAGTALRRLQSFVRIGQSTMTRVDLARLLIEVSQFTAPKWRDGPQMEGRSIALTVDTLGPAYTLADANDIRELLTNLVFNAVDAMPTGGHIVLRARQVGSEVELEVVDTGVGMHRDVSARIFEPFFSTKGDQGTGLGLSIAAEIVERHGGAISIDSEPGRGTTVHVSFPSVDAEMPSVEGSVDPPLAMVVLDELRHLKVMAVDDETRLGHLIAGMLQPLGHKVVVAETGEEALRFMADAVEPFDVVISDLGMGSGMNGWSLASEVKQTYDDVQFILATGWAGQLDSEAAQREGVDAIVSKPYRAEDLTLALARCEAARKL